MTFRVLISSAIFSVASAFTAHAQQNITVNVNQTLNNVSRNPIGINMNYLMDDQYITPSPTISTTDAIKNLGVNFLRYPGGEKSDNYLWSIPPYDKPNPRFARTGYCDWPSGDSRFANSDYTTMKPEVQDFDEFIVMSRTIGGTPLIVVPYDVIYKASTCNGTVPTKEQLLVNAEEWVKYANIRKGYNIKYWMIGNESYKSCDYNGCATAAQYRDDIILFSRRMKAVDPSIKIIANGEGDAWWATVLPTAGPYIDYLGLSNYPTYNFSGGYSYYKNSAPDFIGGVRNATNALNMYAPAADKSRIKIITTEYNAIDWANQWSNTNDLGHALASFEIMGQHLRNPNVFATLFWNTRWVDNLTKPNDINDAFDKYGNALPTGLALGVWGNNLLERMVASSSTLKVRTFATYKQSTNELHIFLVNKELTALKTNIALNNYVANAYGDRWNLRGTGPDDKAPKWTKVGSISASGNAMSMWLPPVSITMIRLSLGAPLASTTLRGAEDAESVEVNQSPEVKPFIGELLEVNPNPAKDAVRISINTRSTEKAYLRAVSMDGKQVYGKELTNLPAREDMDISSWPKGVYILELRVGMLRKVQKLVVQ